jgi:hypothetical protein
MTLFKITLGLRLKIVQAGKGGFRHQRRTPARWMRQRRTMSSSSRTTATEVDRKVPPIIPSRLKNDKGDDECDQWPLVEKSMVSPISTVFHHQIVRRPTWQVWEM